MSETHESFKPGELCRVSVTCPECEAVITFDMRKMITAPEKCNGCGTLIPGLKRALVDYRNFQEGAAQTGLALSIETEPAPAKP